MKKIRANDFTKEELLEILWAVDYVRERTTNRSDAMRRLQGNILSMIDNYCEHECRHEWVSLFVIDEDNLRVLGGTGYKCLKCDRIIPQAWGRQDENQ